MLPWTFVNDKQNYDENLFVYYSDMCQLPKEHLGAHSAFTEGQFSTQLNSSNPFGRTPIDQVTEETVIRDTKTASGTCRFSLDVAAVNQYYQTAE